MTQHFLALCALLSAVSVLISSAGAASLITTNGSWRMFKGRTEASSPDIGAWRASSFNDSAFTNTPAPFTYGEGITEGTDMSDMLNSYSCFFLRKTFTVTNVSEIAALRVGAKVDDGFVIWINGAEVVRVNVAGAPGDPVTINTLAAGATEPVPFLFYDIPSPSFLVNGVNAMAVQVFNTTLNSSDVVFDTSLDSVQVETNPPVVLSVTPPPGSTLNVLTQMTVELSEPVQGLSADDLNVHGIGATGLGVSGNFYTFSFPPAPYGQVPITWVTGHGIADLAFPPNAFDETKPGATWSYTVVDNIAPVVTALFPSSGTTVQTLGQIQISFSEALAGLNASDLLINGQPATNLLVLPNAVYVFQFAQPLAGTVTASWATGHGITDASPGANSFVGASWNYTLDPNANLTGLMITEINAANQNGLKDEDGEEQDWIEIFNSSTNNINLAGWSLSEDADEPGRWIFPSRVLGARQYLVVFASGKDRKNPTGTNRLHTNFKLSGDGEFIGLFTPDSPRILASSFGAKFPVQRNDFSFGRDPNGDLRYFAAPTPGASNGPSTIVGVTEKVHFSASRGLYSQPFNLVLSSATRGATIRYTTNGTEPTLVNGFTYVSPLPISTTFLIRAAAFRTNLLSSAIESHSYFFNVSAAIRSLPIISIQTAQNNLTGTNGIIGMSGGSGPPSNPWVATGPGDYHNPTKTGILWEKPMSVEFIRPTDNSGFHIDAGMRVQGSDYTRPRYAANDKFSYRLYFRGDYSSSRLRYPLFSDSVVEEFDQIVLRAGHNDISNPFLRDELARQLHADMGQAAVHGTWVNFFINGVYKGYYNPTERVEEGFLQSWHGGSNSWDILTVGSAVQGGDNVEWNAMRNYVSSQDVNQPAVFNEIQRRLDVVNFIDYLIVNSYAATWDWPHNNWRAARERAPGGKFRFYVWDAEGAFGEFDGRSAASDSFTGVNSPLLNGTAEIPTLYTRLRNSREFRLLWADRVQKHFYNNGAMTDSNITSRFLQMRSELSGVIPNMNANILNSFIPQRRAPLLAQYNNYGLFASSNAPVFSQHGGTVAPGFNLTMSANQGGTIYYTTNGADPRVMYTGAVSNAALAYAGPVSLNQSTLVKARALNGTNWSALTEANFAVATVGPSLRITEINYNPSGSTAYEFIELQNIGTAPVDLTGMNFEGVTFAFPTFSSLAGGARLVLASDFDPSAFTTRYPGVTVRGYYSGSLNNGGERITLKDANGNVITSLDYDDGGGWPASADGLGHSLEIVNPFGDPDDPANWRASTTLGGTPGAASTVSEPGAVRLNEVLAENLGAVNNAGAFPDFVELANTSGVAVDLSGWSLTDDVTAAEFMIPPGTSIAAGGHLVIWCDAATNTSPGLHAGFSLGRNGENIFLYNASGGLVDAFTYGIQLPNYSVGRVSGEWTLNTPTPNAANVSAPVGTSSSLVINEFLANALPGTPDWIELFNNSALPVGLRGTFISNTGAVHQITSLSFVAPYGFVQLFADEGNGPDHLDFKLSATGGTIVFYNTVAAEVSRVTYSAQGEGVSRGRLPDGAANMVNFPGTSSPGATNYTASYFGPVLNEVLARNVSAVTNAAGRAADYVELYNGSSSAFSLAGFSLSVNGLQPGQWIFPPGATVPGQSYLVVWCDDGQPASTNAPLYNVGQSLDGDSGGVYLFNPAGQLVNSVEYGFQVVDRPVGLIGSAWRLLSASTPGAANATAATLGITSSLRINEWMAQDDGGSDWVELFNSSALPVDMTGLLLTDDPRTAGTNVSRFGPLSFIGASNFVQCVADAQPDQGRNHVGFELDALGETIRLYAVGGTNVIDTVVFGVQGFTTSQGRMPDGGASVVSFPGSATPAAANYRLLIEVAVNEALTHANAPLEDVIELRNLNGSDTDLSGWYLSDSAAMLRKFRIPNGTVISSNGFVVFTESQFNSGVNAFSLNRARGGELWLSSVDANGALTDFRTSVKYGAASEGVTFGAYLASGGSEFIPLATRTLPGANSGPLVGPVVLNELMYHPPEGVSGAGEFVELRNITSAAVNLFDPARPSNTWRLGDGISYAFPANTTLAANQSLLVVDFDPAADALALAAFRAYYGVSASVPIFGPFLGKLDNGGETIELFKPDLPEGTFIPYERVDKVSYRDTAPWPEGAVDGGGMSLQRRSASAYGNDAANWTAALPTAGAMNVSGGIAPPTIVKSPGSTNVLINTDLLLQADATGTGPLSWQWRFNGSKLEGQTNSSLFINYLQPTDAGAYDVYVNGPGGPAFSAVAQVGVAEPPLILSAPTGLYITNAGSNAVLNVLVSGTAPLSYQWRLDGAEIPGATTPVLSFTNAAITHSGPYELTISNAYGIARTNIHFVVSVRPVITNHLQAQTVLQGGTAVFQVVAGPDHPFARLGYRWLRNGASFLTNQSPILIVTNVQVSATYRVAITNQGNVAGVFSPTAGSVQLTVLADLDRDGVADYWESNYFGINSTNNAANALEDPDGDSMSNRDEYVAGTNPTDASSVLKLFTGTANQSVLEFVAQPNISYTVQWGTNVTAWNSLTNINAQSGVRTIQVDTAVGPPSREKYLRVVTPMVP